MPHSAPAAGTYRLRGRFVVPKNPDNFTKSVVREKNANIFVKIFFAKHVENGLCSATKVDTNLEKIATCY